MDVKELQSGPIILAVDMPMDDDRHHRCSRHDIDAHHRHDGGDEDHRRRHHRDKDGGGGGEDDRRHRHHHDKDDSRSHRYRDGGDDDHRHGNRQSVSPSESPPPSSKWDCSSSRPWESIERRDSTDREPRSSSQKWKGHKGGGDGDELDREGGKRVRASVDPPPPKEERPRRERRRFEDVDAIGKNGDITAESLFKNLIQEKALMFPQNDELGSVRSLGIPIISLYHRSLMVVIRSSVVSLFGTLAVVSFEL
ncbi:pre-mRNA-splicing factor cwc25-like [Miscanthus floridulus]|uniref:pre-mRNA-splicing factor cwc25-like n=1 Tax=Miscanthus floridulus TaxID=154761 RepID=UPI0034587A38